MAEDQKTSAKANFATVAASAAATINPHFAAMLASLGGKDDRRRCAPALIRNFIELVFMARTATFDIGQYTTYLWLLSTPFFIYSLLRHVVPSNPIDLKPFRKAFSCKTLWFLWGHVPQMPRKRKGVRQYKISVSTISEVDKNDKAKVSSDLLFPFVTASFRVGCRVERFLHQLGRPPFGLLPATPLSQAWRNLLTTPTPHSTSIPFGSASTITHLFAWPILPTS
jgi:hypothetical protein